MTCKVGLGVGVPFGLTDQSDTTDLDEYSGWRWQSIFYGADLASRISRVPDLNSGVMT
jgi:hypothetical protein